MHIHSYFSFFRRFEEILVKNLLELVLKIKKWERFSVGISHTTWKSILFPVTLDKGDLLLSRSDSALVDSSDYPSSLWIILVVLLVC